VRRHVWLIPALVSVLLVVGCAAGDRTEARFLRYQTLQDGTRVAVVAPVNMGAAPARLQAAVAINDLKEGDLVLVEDLGRNWDLPQWKPSARVISRVPAP
jgi:hypothetical protein